MTYVPVAVRKAAELPEAVAYGWAKITDRESQRTKDAMYELRQALMDHRLKPGVTLADFDRFVEAVAYRAGLDAITERAAEQFFETVTHAIDKFNRGAA